MLLTLHCSACAATREWVFIKAVTMAQILQIVNLDEAEAQLQTNPGSVILKHWKKTR